MKPNTRIWLKCENVGKPQNTLVLNDSARECTLAIATWLMGIYMGQKIRIIAARTEEELHDNKRSSNVNSMMNDLESIIGGTPEPEDSEHVNGSE